MAKLTQLPRPFLLIHKVDATVVTKNPEQERLNLPYLVSCDVIVHLEEREVSPTLFLLIVAV